MPNLLESLISTIGKKQIGNGEDSEEISAMEQFENQLNPLQMIDWKNITSIRKKQMEEAAEQGVPTENLLAQILKPKNIFDPGGVEQNPQGQATGVRQAGIIPQIASSVLGQEGNAEQVLKQLLTMSQMQQGSSEMQAEQRRQHAEERLTKQYELNKKAQYGGVVSSQDLEENPDLNATIEAYGIPARVNKETGERVWNLPDRYKQRAMATQQMPTPAEEQFFNDTFDAIDTTKEVLSGMEELGMKDPTKFGTIIPETIMSEFGPFSIPARFDLVGQYAKDPKYTAMKVKLERVFQKYRKMITGAQASYTELKLLRPLIASFTQRPEVFFEVANGMVQEGERMVTNRLDLMDGVGRNTQKLRDLVDKRQGKTNQPASVSKDFTQDKKKRLEELRRKKAEGTLGR